MPKGDYNVRVNLTGAGGGRPGHVPALPAPASVRWHGVRLPQPARMAAAGGGGRETKPRARESALIQGRFNAVSHGLSCCVSYSVPTLNKCGIVHAKRTCKWRLSLRLLSYLTSSKLVEILSLRLCESPLVKLIFGLDMIAWPLFSSGGEPNPWMADEIHRSRIWAGRTTLSCLSCLCLFCLFVVVFFW